MSGVVVSSGIKVIRNKHAGPSVFSDESNNGRVIVEWAGFNDPDGSDFQEVPEYVVKLPSFRKALSRGIFEIVDDDDIDHLYATGQQWQDARSTAFNDIESKIDRSTQKDMIAVSCIGPGQNGTECGAGIVLAANAVVNAVPALCSAHKHLAASYALVTGEDGKDKWVRASFTRRNDVGE